MTAAMRIAVFIMTTEFIAMTIVFIIIMGRVRIWRQSQLLQPLLYVLYHCVGHPEAEPLDIYLND